MTSLDNGWYRCSVTLADVGSGGSNTPGVTFQLVNTTGGNFTSTNIGDGLYLWGAQAELSTILTDYQFTTTTHQPYADSNAFLKPEVFEIEQKTIHTSEVIQWQLSSVLDKFGVRIPRRQITRDNFPGVGRQRGLWR